MSTYDYDPSRTCSFRDSCRRPGSTSDNVDNLRISAIRSRPFFSRAGISSRPVFASSAVLKKIRRARHTRYATVREAGGFLLFFKREKTLCPTLQTDTPGRDEPRRQATRFFVISYTTRYNNTRRLKLIYSVMRSDKIIHLHANPEIRFNATAVALNRAIIVRAEAI